MFKIVLCEIESWDLIEFKNIWDKDFGRIPFTENKYLEMQLYHYGTFLGFTLDLHHTGIDHAGPSLSISFLTFTFDIRIYDHRHWNDEENRWEKYPGESEEAHVT